jgi:glycosyltransferase involved in cell wall biosynthesis
VQDGYNGYLAEPGNINNMKEAMNKVIEKPIPSEHVVETSKNMSWDRYAKAILGTLS